MGWPHAQRILEMPIPIISLFCGCGSFDLGFTRAGFQVDLALDIDPAAVASYNLNHGKGIAQEADLSNASAALYIVQLLEARQMAEAPRGIIGGSPCQSFSRGNVHFKTEDIRQNLPRSYAAILKELNRRYGLDFFVFENVHGITYEKHEKNFADFKELFEDAGFRLFEGLLDAVDFQVPQNRPRVFIVGLNSEKYPDAVSNFPMATVATPTTIDSVISSLPLPQFFSRKLDCKQFPHHPNHWTMNPKSPKFQNGFLQEGQNMGRSFRVLSWKQPSWTVAYGNREIHIHPSGTRRLSVYEAMRIQGLPHGYQLLGNLSDQIRQVSDAVPPQLGQALATSIHILLAEHAVVAADGLNNLPVQTIRE